MCMYAFYACVIQTVVNDRHSFGRLLVLRCSKRMFNFWCCKHETRNKAVVIPALSLYELQQLCGCCSLFMFNRMLAYVQCTHTYLCVYGVWNTLIIINPKHQSWYVQRSSSHRQMVTAHIFVIFLSIVKVWLCENYNWDSFFFYSWVFGLSLTVSVFSCLCCAFNSFVHFVRVSNVFSIWFNIVEPFVIILIFVCSKVCQYSVWNIVYCVCVYVKEINTQFTVDNEHTVIPYSSLDYWFHWEICLPEARQGCFTVMSTYGHFWCFIHIHILNDIQNCFASFRFIWWVTKCNAFSHKMAIPTSLSPTIDHLLLSMTESDCKLNCANAECCHKHKISFVLCVEFKRHRVTFEIWNGDVTWQTLTDSCKHWLLFLL